MKKNSCKKIMYALIGTGSIAETHIRAIKGARAAELAGILSLQNPSRGQGLAEKYNVKNYKHYSEVLADKSVNAVDIIARNDLHAKLGIDAAKHGKHVLVEKPIAVTLKDADKLIKKCKKNKVRLSVISQNRFAPIFRKLKNEIKTSKFGNINLVSFSWFLNKDKKYYTDSPWRASKKQSGGGWLMMNAIHYIDLLIWLFGPVKVVRGEIKNIKFKDIEVEDTASATIRFRSGATAVVTGSTAAAKSRSPKLEITGSKKNFIFEDKDYLIANQDMFMKLIEDFSSAIKENRAPGVSGKNGMAALEIVRAIYKSAKSHKIIKIK